MGNRPSLEAASEYAKWEVSDMATLYQGSGVDVRDVE
jgi:hypothetical protein